MAALEASLLSGFLAGLFTLAGALAAHRLQRSLAQDERMWSRRAETYVSLLQYQGSGMVEGDIESATAPEWNVREELTAKAKAFASDEVLDLWQKSAQANLAVENYVGEQWPELTVSPRSLAAEDEADKDLELQRLRQASAQASKQLAAQIRAELDVARRRRPWQSRQVPSQDSLPASFTSNPPPGKLPPAGPE
jgi:hypothetical protein